MAVVLALVATVELRPMLLLLHREQAVQHCYAPLAAAVVVAVAVLPGLKVRSVISLEVVLLVVL